MRIHLVTPYCLRRTSTNRIYDVRLCEGFAQNGCDVEIITPYVFMPENVPKSHLKRYYGLRAPVRITELPTPLKDGWSDAVCGLIMQPYLLGVGCRVVVGSPVDGTVVIARNANSLAAAIMLKRLFPQGQRVLVANIVSEVKSSSLYRWLYRSADVFLTGSPSASSDLQAYHDVRDDAIFEILSPIPDNYFDLPATRHEARDLLDIQVQHGRALVVYTGKLFPQQREIDHVLSAARLTDECEYLITGGKPSVVEMYRDECARRGLDNVRFTGFIDDSTQIRLFQKAADILVSYYTSQDHLTDYNIPQKIPEYMATGNPLVTPDYPATRSILDESNSVFVEAENPESLASGIRWVLQNPNAASEKAQRALERVQSLTFRRRAKEIMAFFTRQLT